MGANFLIQRFGAKNNLNFNYVGVKLIVSNFLSYSQIPHLG